MKPGTVPAQLLARNVMRPRCMLPSVSRVQFSLLFRLLKYCPKPFEFLRMLVVMVKVGTWMLKSTSRDLDAFASLILDL